MTRVAIVGLGLIGGSIALALRAVEPAVRIAAVDVASTLARPEARAIADELFEPDALELALADAEIAFLAAPVKTIEALVVRALQHADVVTDCGSTKRSIVAAARSSPRFSRFVPGHPMAGGPAGGAARARADLFRGKRWLLCPEHADPEARERVERVVSAFGASVLSFGVDAHDEAVALTSHVPQLLAAALLETAAARGALSASGPSFESATRSASDNEEMWRDVLASNADAIARALDALDHELRAVRDGLAATPPDVAPALALLRSARGSRHN